MKKKLKKLENTDIYNTITEPYILKLRQKLVNTSFNLIHFCNNKSVKNNRKLGLMNLLRECKKKIIALYKGTNIL